MKKQYKTAKGKTFDMEQFTNSLQKTVAVGNLGGGKPTNARGDILGKGGKIETSREKIVQNYYRKELPQQTTQSIKDPVTETEFKSLDDAMNDLTEESNKRKSSRKRS